MTKRCSAIRLAGLLGALILTSSQTALAGAYIFAGEANGVDVIAHPPGYSGAGGVVNVKVCVAPGTPNASAMEVSVQNVINTINRFEARQPNLAFNSANNVPSNAYDFESVALHEVGHCIGLAHPNLGFRQGVVEGANEDYTASTDGADNAFDFNDGLDNIIGSADDRRDDDLNLHWFFINENNPFVRSAVNIDESSYTRDLAELPFGDDYAANASRDVGDDLGVANTEAVMQQGTFIDEAQRDLAVDDVATLAFARSGLDEVAGTSDDYTVVLEYGGISSATDCDIDIAFDAAITAFAFCSIPSPGGTFRSNGGTDYAHVEMEPPSIRFNTNFNWFFNNVSNALDYTLDLLLGGDGRGTVTDDLGQIDCFQGVGDDCEGLYPNRTEVTLSASADQGNFFAGWSGDCSGENETLSLTLEADRLCTATFNRLGQIDFRPTLIGLDEPNDARMITVSLSKDPTEDVLINLSSNRPEECVPNPAQVVIPAGTDTAFFDVEAVADDAVDGQQACTVLAANSISNDPAFNDLELDQINVVVDDINVALTISKAGTGSGRVFGDQGRVDCGDQCEGVYEAGDSVSLLVEADTGSAFTGWSGASACQGNGRLDLTLNDDLACTATFVTLRGLTVSPTQFNIREPDDRETITVTLDSAASADVSMTIQSSDIGECTSSTDVLTIPAGNLEASFDVLAVDDAEQEATQTCFIDFGQTSSPDPLFNGITPPVLSVTVLDNDDPQYVFSDRFER
jgi:hypothetical protein